MKNESPNNFPSTDAALNAALRRLPDVRVASNFTARVMRAVELEDAKLHRSRHWHWRALFPRVATATALVLFAGIIFRHEFSNNPAVLGKTIAQITASESLPSVDALKNFDAIQRMSKSTSADGELLADLQ
jgi:hypothetical protein